MSTPNFITSIGLYLISVLLGFPCLFPIHSQQEDRKPKPEEVVEKHLLSLGSTKAISEAVNRTIQGRSRFRDVQVSIVNFEGSTSIVFSPDNFGLQLVFRTTQANQYTQDHFVYDGKKVTIPLGNAVQRSPLGSFLLEYQEVLKSGLFGGTLSANWSLLEPKDRIRKFEVQGKEKVNGVEAYVVKCFIRSSTNLLIKLYFQTSDLRHLRTVYYTEISPPVTIHDEGRISSVRKKLVEDFTGHTVVNDLLMPTVYKITYSFESPSRQREYEWVLSLSRYEFVKPAKTKPAKTVAG